MTKSKTLKVVVVRAEEWEGIYIDGELASENHDHDLHWIAALVNGKPFTLEVKRVSDEFDAELCETGALPFELSEVRF